MTTLTPELIASFFPKRVPQSHKGSYGRVLVVASSVGMCGAGVLCAKSALKAGAGLVTLALPEHIQPATACQLPEMITLPLPQTENGVIAPRAADVLLDFIRTAHIDLLLIGPGLGVAEFVVPFLRQCSLPAVIDADALNQLAASHALEELFPRSAPCIFTPHPGEMERLMKEKVPADDNARAELARALALQTGGVCVLKGHHTVVSDGACVWQNPTGGPALAKAGTGDVLCGLIGGFWAQLGKAHGFTAQTAARAAACGVYLHGLCGDLAARYLTDSCVLASDLLHYLPFAVKQTVYKEGV